MLKVTIHTGDIASHTAHNELAALHIAYAKREALADYLVAMSLRGAGEIEPDLLEKYPRWSASLWDLTARALTRLLYRADQAPPTATPDRRCAYATRICAVIEGASGDDRGRQLATVEIAQNQGRRGVYTAIFNEDILGRRTADFSYGLKSMNSADLLLRAICWTFHGSDVLGRMPALALPPLIRIDGVDRFHIEALVEPARTGFLRHVGVNFPAARAPDPLPKADDYAYFLMKC